MTGRPQIETIDRVSPTGINLLASCARKFASSRRGAHSSRTGARTAAQRLGLAAHAAIQAVISSGQLHASDLDSVVEAAWAQAIGDQSEDARSVGDVGRYGSPEEWHGYFLRAALLRRSAKRLAELTSGIGTDAQLLPEVRLEDPATGLYGYADLVVRSAAMHAVIELKTGAVLEEAGSLIRPEFERQLLLYAHLERAVSGSLPTELWLLPLAGEAVQIDANPNRVDAAVAAVGELIERYNAIVPEFPDGTPSASACRYCRYIVDCDSFWSSSGDVGADGFTAFRGAVRAKRLTPLGGWSVTLVGNDELADSEVTVRRFDPATFPELEAVQAGDIVAVTAVRDAALDGDPPDWVATAATAVHPVH